MHVDAMGIDALVTGMQEGVEALPDLGVPALSDGGRERAVARSASPESW